MIYEQLDIDNQLNAFPGTVPYSRLDCNEHIYCKIDWLTVVFNDCCINDILSWINMDDCISDFMANMFQQSRGYDDIFKFVYEGVLIESSTFSFYDYDECKGSMFDFVVPKIRLELSGTALDYLRSLGIDDNYLRFVEPILPDGGAYHFTRCDWAFDFINYKGDFVDNLIQHINIHSLASGRVPLASTKGAISVRVVTGNQKTVYLGSPQSDKMLRVYDKRLQYINPVVGVYTKPNPYNDPDSWIRIEWQTRNKTAHNLMSDSAIEFKHVLKEVFTAYAFADGTCDNNHMSRPVVDFWNELLPWQEIEKRIIQNAKYVELVDPDQRAVRTFNTIQWQNFVMVYSLLGRKGFEKMVNENLKLLYKPDPVSRRRYTAFLCRLNCLSISDNIPQDMGSGGLVNIGGRLAFTL